MLSMIVSVEQGAPAAHVGAGASVPLSLDPLDVVDPTFDWAGAPLHAQHGTSTCVAQIRWTGIQLLLRRPLVNLSRHGTDGPGHCCYL
jgi:hypothetical protein